MWEIITGKETDGLLLGKMAQYEKETFYHPGLFPYKFNCDLFTNASTKANFIGQAI